MLCSKQENILMIMYAKAVGGAELQFLELANFLAKSFRVRLICLGGDGALKNVRLSENIEIQVYPYSRGVNSLIALARAFWENVGFPSRSIVTTSFIGNVLGFLIGKLKKARLVSLQTVSVCMRHPFIDREVLRRFDVLVAGAEDIKAYLLSHGQAKNQIQVVHNWVDFSKRTVTESAEETKARWGVDGKLTIGCIGRLHPQKGHQFLIRAFEIMAKDKPGFRLLLVGDGELRDLLEKQVIQSGLSEKVIFTGIVTGVDYNNILQAIDIYVQPSVFEGLPRTLLDAMYLCKPIVATDINGNKEAIEHMVSGLLVPPKDAKALSNAMSTLIADPELRVSLSSRASQRAKEQFEMNAQLEKIRTIVQG